jgi:hypothetical protein
MRTAQMRSFFVACTASLVCACGSGDTGPAGAPGAAGAAGAAGATGSAGPQGSPGSSSADGGAAGSFVYGDGSGGALDVTTEQPLTGNTQFTTIHIESAGELYVASGTTLLATGAVKIDGAIFVNSGAYGGDANFGANGETAQPGIGLSAALNGADVASGHYAFPGYGASGVGVTFAASLYNTGSYGGGGGGGDSYSGGGIPSGAAGGGAVRILARGPVTISGTVYTEGADGGGSNAGEGGGGGGVVILASQTSITVTGNIRAQGGKGGDANHAYGSGSGGGGGGGLVHFIAPVVTNTGTVNVAGGAIGVADATAATSAIWHAGSGGGGSVGNGGVGGSVEASGVTNGVNDAAAAGGAGLSVTTLADPTALFL